jgi:hypothetical protein
MQPLPTCVVEHCHPARRAYGDRAVSSRKTPVHQARYEAKKRAAGFVRGPRITADASERLHALAYRYKLTPCEVVSRLLLDMPLDGEHGASVLWQRREGLSDVEMREVERLAGSQRSVR